MVIVENSEVGVVALEKSCHASSKWSAENALSDERTSVSEEFAFSAPFTSDA